MGHRNARSLTLKASEIGVVAEYDARVLASSGLDGSVDGASSCLLHHPEGDVAAGAVEKAAYRLLPEDRIERRSPFDRRTVLDCSSQLPSSCSFCPRLAAMSRRPRRRRRTRQKDGKDRKWGIVPVLTSMVVNPSSRASHLNQKAAENAAQIRQFVLVERLPTVVRALCGN